VLLKKEADREASFFFYYGTGSYPEPPQGWHRKMRFSPSQHPRAAPYFCMASSVYCEQVGVKRQEGGVSGEMERW